MDQQDFEAPGARSRVLAALAERRRTGSRPGRRTDGLRIALAVEGGGMRGIISGGMALALHEAGLTGAFDAVYGASAGALTGAWLLSGDAGQLAGWADAEYARAMVRPGNPLRGRPVVDLHHLVEHLYAHVARMDFDAILANPTTLHPLATHTGTGLATDLHPLLTDPARLRLALRASAALPLLAGPPVELAGSHYYDAGLAESIPFRTALAQGATHVLVLRSRGSGTGAGAGAGAGAGTRIGTGVGGAAVVAGPSRGSRMIARTVLRRYPAPLRDSYLGRAERLRADEELLGRHDLDPPADGPAVLSVRPGPDAPKVGRLARDSVLLRAALEAGQAAMDEVIARLPRPRLP
ncbi:patatin-like phospholipase family protein [Kitasatospora sp. NA04385]|uniref:patatin-like phospholipase family protein n=1 Tax=Kitasatospora sp. NA04385 TaxID=2742135 RepID=UPI00158FADD7|nr:patatin-like phospholipase family protein [Kitasatospora sp. NA04385]QKW18580.1 patatin-like phospholipase family protein [Kitasatospora sp. NA04385]